MQAPSFKVGPGFLSENPMRRSRKPQHPTYVEMVNEAIASMKDRKGSSRQAIERYITSKYTLGSGSHSRLNTTLNRLVTSESLVQTKGKGATGSFKINKAQEGESAPAAAPAGASKAKAKKKKSPKKKKKKKGKKKSPKKKKKSSKKKKKKSPKKKKKKSPKKKKKSAKKKKKSPKKKKKKSPKKRR